MLENNKEKNMKHLRLIIIISFIVLCIYQKCSIIEPDCELSGDVFIVTKGRENLKMSLVTLYFVPEDTIRKYVTNQTIDSAKTVINNIRPQLDELKDDIDSLKRDLKWAEKDWKIDLLKSSIEFYEAMYGLIGKHYLTYMTGEYFYKLLTEYHSDYDSVKTDSDGKYSIKLNKNTNYAVLANSTREIISKTEEYYWIFWYSTNKKSKDILSLNNDNLFENNPQNNILDILQIYTDTKYNREF